jgi:hypothetical protein
MILVFHTTVRRGSLLSSVYLCVCRSELDDTGDPYPYQERFTAVINIFVCADQSWMILVIHTPIRRGSLLSSIYLCVQIRAG